MKPIGLLIAALVLIGSSGACTRAHTLTKVKNAGEVGLSFRRIGSATVEPITAGTTDVNLRLSVIDVDEDGYLQREGGVLRIACAKCEGKTFTLLDGERLSASVDRSVEELVASSRGAGRVEMPFEYAVSSAQELYPVVRTPASNIEYFEQTTEPVRELGWLLVPGGALLVIGLIVIPQDTVAGMAMFTPGLALSAFGGLHLVLPEEVQRYNASGRPVATRPARPATRAATSTSADTPASDATDEGEAPENDNVDADDVAGTD